MNPKQHNVIVVLVIPAFDADGNLPPGVHPATWEELESAFGATAYRKQLLNGLSRAAKSLKTAGCSALYLDGSFVTQKDFPGDFDACWEPYGVDPTRLDPILLDFTDGRLAQKLKYSGELFPSTFRAEASPPHRTFLEFFQVDKNTGKTKGVISLDLQRMP